MKDLHIKFDDQATYINWLTALEFIKHFYQHAPTKEWENITDGGKDIDHRLETNICADLEKKFGHWSYS
jgi:hypothetical protein